MLTYNTRIQFSCQEDKEKISDILEAARIAWNDCSKVKFSEVPLNSIVHLHAAFYRKFRDSSEIFLKDYKKSDIPAQIVICAEKDCLSAYRSIKSNKHKTDKPSVKLNKSLRLDIRTYSYKNGIFSIISMGKRVKCKIHIYPKLRKYLDKYAFCDPLIFEKNNEIWMAISFRIPEIPQHTEPQAIGIDLGIKNLAATSEGIIYRDKSFNARKRKIRFLKRKLSSKGSKSARKHFKKLSHREFNQKRNLLHNLANRLIQNTSANTLVLENLEALKVKKRKYQKFNRISQVSFAGLRTILEYKALLHNKRVITVSPAYTSQIDHRTGKKDGIRKGSRYIGSDGKTLHADTNAAINIGRKSNLPCLIDRVFAWQAVVMKPIVFKSCGRKSMGITSP